MGNEFIGKDLEKAHFEGKNDALLVVKFAKRDQSGLGWTVRIRAETVEALNQKVNEIVSELSKWQTHNQF